MKNNGKLLVTISISIVLAILLCNVCLAYAETTAVFDDLELIPFDSGGSEDPASTCECQSDEFEESLGQHDLPDGDVVEGYIDPIQQPDEPSERQGGSETGAEVDTSLENETPGDIGDSDGDEEPELPEPDVPEHVDEDESDLGEGVNEAPDDIDSTDEPPGDEKDLDPDVDESGETVCISVVIEHIVKWNEIERLVGNEALENIQVGASVVGAVYALTEPGLEFIGSDPEVLLVGEDENLIRLYYIIDAPDIPLPEAPDFPPGEGLEIDSPYIEVFEGALKGMPGINSNKYVLNCDQWRNIDWPQPGSLLLEKGAEAVQGSGYKWDITLTIEGKNLIETTDIVLVIDCSNSMQNDNKITRAKEAAQAFVESLLTPESQGQLRIAVVSFGSYAKTECNFCDYNQKSTLVNAINNIHANWGNYGGTHMQAGIRQARGLFSNSSADHKDMVILGDGAATYSYNINEFSESYFDFWYEDYYWGDRYYRSNTSIPESSFNYNKTIGDGTSEYYWYGRYVEYFDPYHYIYDTYYIRHGASAVAEAGFAKNQGIEVYSIALSAGSEGEWALSQIANDGKYYETSDPDSLEQIFLEISGRICCAASNAVVTDPIGEMFYIPGITGENVDELVEVSHGQVHYDESSRTLRWDIGTIAEGNTYTMKYRLYMSFDADLGVDYPTNGDTPIDYQNIDGNNARKYFEVPTCKMRGITFEKLLDDTLYQNTEFDIVLQGPEGPYQQTWTVSLTPGSGKTVKGLLPGIYTVREIVPMNFEPIGIYTGEDCLGSTGGICSLEVSDEDWSIDVSVTNRRSNDGWFWDDDQVTNTFQVAVWSGGICGSDLILNNLRCAGLPKPCYADSQMLSSDV
jgi:hypothetical protein